MKLGIMQPYFFPYLGYFQLINAVDEFILFDVVQYTDRSWINRNKILSSNLEKEWTYITVSIINHKQKDLISDIKINNNVNWINKIEGQLSYYKKIRAPYYENVIDALNISLYEEHNLLLNLNYNTIINLCKFFNIKTIITRCSDHKFDLSNVKLPGDWAFEISKQMFSDNYINPIGGKDLFDLPKFNQSEIEVKFIKMKKIHYKQSQRKFIPNLSIIDVMMFNPVEKIQYLLNEFDIV